MLPTLAGGSLLTQPCRFKVYKHKKSTAKKPKRFPRISIILTEDVKHVGVKGEEVNVKRGMARNHLLKQNVGVYATEKSRRLHKTVFGMDEGGETTSTQRMESAALVHLKHVPPIAIKRPSLEEDTDTLLVPIDTAILQDRLMSVGFSWLFQEQILLKKPITTYGRHSFSLDLSLGPIPLGSDIITMKLDVTRWQTDAEYAKIKAEQKERLQDAGI